MKTRIFTFLGLFAIGLVGINPLAHAQVLQLVRSIPAASAVLGSHSHGFYVRFNRPVDHIRSQLSITENGKVFATLHLLADSAADVLFARAPDLWPGHYQLYWVVRALDGAEVLQGDIPFTVGS
jgi:methionine-rich copper-binding protein CopC